MENNEKIVLQKNDDMKDDVVKFLQQTIQIRACGFTLSVINDFLLFVLTFA